MIPSRTLKLVDIISETFSIYGRSLVRYALFFVILFVPGTILVTAGSIGLAQDTITSAQRTIGFNDSDLTTLRNDASAWLAAQNPFFAAEWPVRDTVGVPNPTTTRFLNYVSSNITKFGSSLNLFGFGALLLIIGLFALTAVTIELGSQLFEERAHEFWEPLRAGLTRNAWKMMFLYLLWIGINWVLDHILLLLPGQIGGALAGFITGAQLYVLIRLAVTFPALVSEALGPFAAVRRSWELTQRTAWKVVGTCIAFGILYFFALLAISMILSIFSGEAMNSLNQFFTLPHLTIQWFETIIPNFLGAVAIESSIAMLLVFSLIPVFATVLYYDLRTRHDGPLVYLEE